MHASCRPCISIVVSSSVRKSTLRCGFAIDGVGLTAARNTSGMPSVMPPRMPPQLLPRVSILPPLMQNSSLFSLPRRRTEAKPAPNSMPFTAGMPNTAADIRLSMPPNSAPPSPAGTPSATHSITPPTESPSALACMILSCISFSSCAPPISLTRARMLTPSFSSSCKHIPPAMHSGAVMRPENSPPPVGMLPYLSHAE